MTGLRVLRNSLLVLTLVLLIGQPLAARDQGEKTSGFPMQVFHLEPAGNGEAMGLCPGDVIHAWSRGRSRNTPFTDYLDVYRQQMRHGLVEQVVWHGERNGAARSWHAPTGITFLEGLLLVPLELRDAPELELLSAMGHWQNVDRPALWSSLMERAQTREAKAWVRFAGPYGLLQDGEFLQAQAVYDALQRAAPDLKGEPWLEDILNLRGPERSQVLARDQLGLAALRAFLFETCGLDQWAEPERKLVEESLAGRSPLPHRLQQARHLHLRGAYQEELEVLADALKAFPDPHPFHLARLYLQRGKALNRLKREQESAADLRRALHLFQLSAEEGLEVAECRKYLGAHARGQGRLADAEHYYQASLAITSRLAPGSAYMATTYAHLAGLKKSLGKMGEAEALYTRSLLLLDPGSRTAAAVLNNRGLVYWRQGNLLAAEADFLSALDLFRRLNMGDGLKATALNNLGLVAHERRDWAAARRFLTKSLELKKKQGTAELGLAPSYNNLGRAALEEGEYRQAEEYFTLMLNLFREATPGGLDHGMALNNLGSLAKKEGDLQKAEDYFRRALVIYEALGTDTLETASSLQNLALVLNEQEKPAQALATAQKALPIYESAAPDSLPRATLLSLLGDIDKSRGAIEEALEWYRQAIEVHERQLEMLGGSTIQRDQFAADFRSFYYAYISLLAASGQEEEAFRMLERSRAQSLRRLLAERNLLRLVGSDQDLNGQLEELGYAFDQAQQYLARLPDDTPEAQRQEVQDYLEGLRGDMEKVWSDARNKDPRLKNLDPPQPVPVAEAAKVLPKGTLYLAFLVGQEDALLFSLPAGGTLSVHRMAAGHTDLARQVRRLRQALLGGGSLPDLSGLGATLLGPVAEDLAAADRVLISADGPLHFLPFGLLPAAGKATLLDLAPTHQVTSLTVYGELDRAARTEPGDRLLAMGGVDYGGLNQSASTLRALGNRSGALAPLPWSGREVDHIAEVFKAQAKVLKGQGAREGIFKEGPIKARILHLATHGLINDQQPLDSALALAPGPEEEGQNGLLQAWEVFQQVRLEADLVVLSACDTGLGRTMGGEGVVGLSRAFQYAGADSVLVSLWPLQDEAGAFFSERFYHHLNKGVSKDRALQKAQLDLREDSRFAHPFYWAPYVLLGRP